MKKVGERKPSALATNKPKTSTTLSSLHNVKPKFVRSEFLAKRGQLAKENVENSVIVSEDVIRKSAKSGQVILSSKSLSEGKALDLIFLI